MSKPVKKINTSLPSPTGDYSGLVGGISELLEAARHASARTVNAFMTATYWEVGRRIVEHEQGGEKRAEYGDSLLLRLAEDLTARFGRGFGKSNLFMMRKFFLARPSIFQTASGISKESAIGSSKFQTLSGESRIRSTLANIFQTPSEKSATLPYTLTELARAFPICAIASLMGIRGSGFRNPLSNWKFALI